MKTKIIRMLALAALLLFAFPFASCAGEAEKADCGTLTIGDMTLTEGESAVIEVSFSNADYRDTEIDYTYEGDAIRIVDGVVYARKAGQTVEVTAMTDHHSATFQVTVVAPLYGKLQIADISAWVGYPPADCVPEFTKPEYAHQEIQYEYDEALIRLDAAARTVTALKAGTVTVKVAFGNYRTEFDVVCRCVDDGTAAFNTVLYNGRKQAYAAQWERAATDGKTTAFIGDSFFDGEQYWTNFSDTFAGKDVLCMGISGTTSFDWEQFVTDIFGTKAPKNIVMHVGTNNIYDDNKNAAETTADLQRMFTVLHAAFPETKIYYFGISIRAFKPEVQNSSLKIQFTKQANESMAQWCGQREYVTYIDTPAKLTTDMLADGTHPKLENYAVFTDALAQTDIQIEDKEN